MEVGPKKLFGALGGVGMGAASRRQKPQLQSFAALGLVKIAPQGVAHQGRNRKLFSLGQEMQLTIGAFVEKEGGPLHMPYDAIHHREVNGANRSDCGGADVGRAG